MSLYSVKSVFVQLKGKNRNWCLGRDMDHLANSTAELRNDITTLASYARHGSEWILFFTM